MTDHFPGDFRGGDDRNRPVDPIEDDLRRTLAARAGDAPDAHALTERLLVAGADGAAQNHRRTWTAWGTPLIAAACVAAIVGIVLAVVQGGHSDHTGPDAVATPSLALPATGSATSAPPTRTGTSSATTAEPSTASSTPSATSLPNNITVDDLTFTSTDSGWALGSADCLTGSGRCTALLRTTDGTTWTGHANTPFYTPGVHGCPAASCVRHIRFANDRIGYAYGPDALWMTTDGAQHWTKQSGGADALETLNDDVIRLSTQGGTLAVSTSDLGSTTWTRRSLSGVPARASGFALARTSSAAYIVSLSGPTQGVSSVLWTSTNDGQTWTERGTVCEGYVVVTPTGLSVAPDGSVVLGCRSFTQGLPFVVVGTRAGRSFTRPRALPNVGTSFPFAAAASRTTVLTGVGRLYRSTDGTKTLRAVSGVDVTGGVRFIGFESPQVGRIVSADGHTIWTTRDAGASWTKVTLP
ncbi:hypothetical protein [uncultured Jatrophihabitans sp.]|uniref:hypothetical protein n=1 Tax=uncultured Jatrophihabitans sp. TaxID=1610747 RepID=UPI0035CAD3E8